MAPRRARLTVTVDLLRSAWANRRRPDWPLTFEDCMRHPLYSALVRATAVGMAQAAGPQPTRHPQPRPGPCGPGPALPLRNTQLPLPQRPLPTIDRKRAAAGDLDD